MDHNENNNGNRNGNFKEFICSPIGKAVLIIFLYAVLLGLTVLLVGLFDTGIGFLILLGLFAYFGWKVLNRLTPNIFLIMPVGGWIIYFVVKFLLAVAIGVFVAPFVIAKKITAAIQKNIE